MVRLRFSAERLSIRQLACKFHRLGQASFQPNPKKAAEPEGKERSTAGRRCAATLRVEELLGQISWFLARAGLCRRCYAEPLPGTDVLLLQPPAGSVWELGMGES